MNRLFKKAVTFMALAVLVLSIGLFAACVDNPPEHTEHTFEGNTCTVCGYVKQSEGERPKPGPAGSTAKTYVFEAECTDLGHKTGLGYSGDATGKNMVQGNPASNASGGGWVGYLYAEGVAVGFVIESDKDVTDATLSMRIACEYVNMTFNPDNYKIRVDYGLTATDLEDYDDYWGEFYADVPEGNAEINYSQIALTKGAIVPSFTDYVLTTTLTLHKGLNMISFITNNSMLAGGGLGTMGAIAPMIDCIKVKTDATLTMAVVKDNGFGKNGCYVEE